MPTIKKLKKISNYQRHGKALDIYNKVYNTTQWRKLRQSYLMKHPLCEKCLESNKITPAVEIHHITPISTGKDDLEMKDLGFNPSNLMALCEECHHKIHN